MVKTPTNKSWGVAGLLIAVVALIVVAALPGRTVVSTDDDPLPDDWPQRLSSEVALVAGKQASGGIKLLGVRLQEQTLHLDLHFLGSPDCAPGVCEGPDGLSGEVVGNTIAGDPMVSSRVEVTRECFDLIETSDPWPSHPECVPIAGS